MKDDLLSTAYSTLGRRLLYLVLGFSAILTITFLAYNSLLTELDITAASVDAAGRQRMLSQKIAYTALRASGGSTQAAGLLLAQIAEFDETLAAFEEGGKARSFYVPPATKDIIPLLKKEEQLWKPYRAAALKTVSGANHRETRSALEHIEESSEQLLTACDKVTEAFRLQAESSKSRMNALMLLLIGISLAAAYYAVSFAFRKVTIPLLSLSKAADAFTSGSFREINAEDAGGEIKTLAVAFSAMAGRIQREVEKREALNLILAISTETGDLRHLLGRMLETLLSIPWLSLESKGAVFLAEPGTRNLRMAAQRGMPADVQKSCANVKPGQCLCGRAAITGKTIFSDDIHADHETAYTGMKPHGHYCLPIKTGEVLAGVLTLYVPAGHKYDESEKQFLEAACAVMSRTLEYKTLETRAFQAQKLESLGKAAGAVAHDFNNILTAIKGFNDLVIETAPQDSEPARFAKETAAGIGKGINLVKEILAFSRGTQTAMAKLDLNGVVKAALPMLEMVLQKKVSVNFSPAAELPPITAAKGQLEQVLMNLAVNARDAMLPKGGRLNITTSAGNGTVRLTVSDSGCGMPKEVIERAFEPFFTTKPEGSGTGLGLATVYTIVKKHGGEVTIDSEQDRGTTFTLTFPVA